MIGEKPIFAEAFFDEDAFLPSRRALAITALKDHLEIECEVRAIDLSKGDHRAPEYAALNPNAKMPMLEDDGFVLWESNAIPFISRISAAERDLAMRTSALRDGGSGVTKRYP